MALTAFRVLRDIQYFRSPQVHGSLELNGAEAPGANHARKIQRTTGGDAGVNPNLIAALFERDRVRPEQFAFGADRHRSLHGRWRRDAEIDGEFLAGESHRR